MKLGLISDFIDYYDHHFPRHGVDRILVRNSQAEYTRWEALHMLRGMQQITPEFLILGNMSGGFLVCSPHPQEKWVVHLDQRAHCGEAKILVTWEEAIEKYKGCLAVKYVKTEKTCSTRYLQIGRRAFVIDYLNHTSGEWRSNVGDVEIEVMAEFAPDQLIFPPSVGLRAIDYVRNERGGRYAIDLNTSPGLTGTGIEKILKPAQVYELLCEALTPKKEEIHA